MLNISFYMPHTQYSPPSTKYKLLQGKSAFEFGLLFLRERDIFPNLTFLPNHYTIMCVLAIGSFSCFCENHF